MQRLSILTIFLLLVSQLACAEPALMKPWQAYTTSHQRYEVGTTEEIARSGKSCGYLKSLTSTDIKQHALLFQVVGSQRMRGRTLTLKGFLRAKDINGWAGFWIRAEDGQGRVLAFQNSMEDPLRGTSDWTGRSVSLQIPTQSAKVIFGVLLAGEGSVWVDDMELTTSALTAELKELRTRVRELPEQPKNLQFETQGTN